jgi:hypothetical protein
MAFLHNMNNLCSIPAGIGLYTTHIHTQYSKIKILIILIPQVQYVKLTIFFDTNTILVSTFLRNGDRHTPGIVRQPLMNEILWR